MNKKIIIIIIVIGLVAALGFFIFSRSKSPDTQTNNSSTSTPAVVSEKDPPKIVSTKPEPLDQSIIAATDIIEITFNRALENVGEFKVRMEPKIDFKLELSQDRKTGKIKPASPYELGAEYTIIIGPDTKFDGVGAWGQEKTYKFRTIKYRGI